MFGLKTGKKFRVVKETMHEEAQIEQILASKKMWGYIAD